MWDLEKAADLHEEKIRFLNALANFEQGDLLQETLDRTLGVEVRSQDTIRVIVTVASHRHGRNLAWEFVKDNWDKINEVFPSNSIVRMLSGITSLSKGDQADDVIAFFEDHEVPQGQLTLQQTLEKLRVNVALRERESERFAESLVR